MNKSALLGAVVIGSGLLMAAAALPAFAQDGAPPAVARKAGPTTVPAGTGARKALMIEEASLKEHTIYRPAKLAGGKMPVVVWGNGGCSPAGNSAQEFLTEIASHGYLVIANGAIRDLPPPRQGGAGRAGGAPAPAADGMPPGRVGPPPGAPGTQNLTRTEQLTEAMDWASAQAKDKKSPYYGKIDADKVASMGSSCGGLQAIEVAKDPRVKTLASWSSGLLDYPRAGAAATEADLLAAHGPILYVSGGEGEQAYEPTKKDYARVNKLPIIRADEAGVGHGGPITKPNGGSWGPVAVAWLDWTLKGDKTAAKMFKAPDCTLCKMPGWTVEKKMID